jgi:hypothetical protein
MHTRLGVCSFRVLLHALMRADQDVIERRDERLIRWILCLFASKGNWQTLAFVVWTIGTIVLRKMKRTICVRSVGRICARVVTTTSYSGWVRHQRIRNDAGFESMSINRDRELKIGVETRRDDHQKCGVHMQCM